METSRMDPQMAHSPKKSQKAKKKGQKGRKEAQNKKGSMDGDKESGVKKI
jgi:hypothetical protein